jgi:hypothetical protein
MRIFASCEWIKIASAFADWDAEERRKDEGRKR